MIINVYISQPDSPTSGKRGVEIMDRLREMVNETRVTFVQHHRPAKRRSAFDDLAEGILAMERSDFVIFDNGWKNDRRCLVEDEAVIRYGKPYCRVENLEAFFSSYITRAFNIKEPSDTIEIRCER